MVKVLRNGLLLFTRVAFGHSVGGGYFSRLIPVDDVDIKFVLHGNDFFYYPDALDWLDSELQEEKSS